MRALILRCLSYGHLQVVILNCDSSGKVLYTLYQRKQMGCHIGLLAISSFRMPRCKPHTVLDYCTTDSLPQASYMAETSEIA